MGNHAAAKKIIELACRPLDRRLSDDAIRHLVERFYAKVRAIPNSDPFSRALFLANGHLTSRRCTTSGRQ